MRYAYDENIKPAHLDILPFYRRKDGDIEEDEADCGPFGLAEFNIKTGEYEPIDKKAEAESDQRLVESQQYLRKIPGDMRPCPEGPRFANDLDNACVPARKPREYYLDMPPTPTFK